MDEDEMDLDYDRIDSEHHDMSGMEDEFDENVLAIEADDMEVAVPAEEIRNFCLQKFKATDFIMEPVLMEFLNRYFAADGKPDEAIEALSSSYEGIAQYVNMFAEWLIILGEEPMAVQERIEGYLEEMIIKNFDPKKADRIFTSEGGIPPWMTELVTHKNWRKMIYKLVDVHRDCNMLNFTIKIISEAGFQNEIPATTTAVNQMEVFARVFDAAFGRVVDEGEAALPEFSKLITTGECTYLAAQLAMNSLVPETSRDAPHLGMNLVKIMQEVDESVKGHHTLPTQLILAKGAAWPKQTQAVASMISKGSLNPADIQILFQAYNSDNPPPVALLKFRDFVDMLIESLFSTDPKIPLEHKPKYIYLLSYMSSVHEKWSRQTQQRTEVNKDELKFTIESVRRVLDMTAKGSQNDVVSELPAVFALVKTTVIALGMLYWIGKTVKDPNYFSLTGESKVTPVHLIIVDEIATLHPTLHKRILDLLINFFESPFDQLDVLIRLQLQKMFLDRMIHLISCGCVIPVLQYVKAAHGKQDTDVSVFRHFVVELLDIITPECSTESKELLLPLVSDSVITGALRLPDGKDPVSIFLEEGKKN
ncbi:hypothetical protein RvY_06118 [Ramazzottius varieornatus]|uniref:Negative elongation factor C/D n=1 Tax=Ramazzottius varieornatus TaxID=947166 RepID=A0A1D1UXG4_RAMVA|nr:hypothetical protein RvY_06118 [Ramazzottius varieornatus]